MGVLMIKPKSMSRTALMCRYAVCLALLVVCAQIMIVLPLTPVPVTLAFFMVFVIGGVLGPYHGTLCILVYILMGLVGLPVFAGFKSAALLGPTGGYIIGYMPMAAIVGLFFKLSDKTLVQIAGMLLGMSASYFCGMVWYAIISGVTLLQSFMLTVLPFVLADIFKMLLALMVIRRLNKALLFAR